MPQYGYDYVYDDEERPWPEAMVRSSLLVQRPVAADADDARALLDAATEPLDRPMPELRDSLGAPDASEPLDPEQERRRLSSRTGWAEIGDLDHLSSHAYLEGRGDDAGPIYPRSDQPRQ